MNAELALANALGYDVVWEKFGKCTIFEPTVVQFIRCSADYQFAQSTVRHEGAILNEVMDEATIGTDSEMAAAMHLRISAEYTTRAEGALDEARGLVDKLVALGVLVKQESE